MEGYYFVLNADKNNNAQLLIELLSQQSPKWGILLFGKRLAEIETLRLALSNAGRTDGCLSVEYEPNAKLSMRKSLMALKTQLDATLKAMVILELYDPQAVPALAHIRWREVDIEANVGEANVFWQEATKLWPNQLRCMQLNASTLTTQQGREAIKEAINTFFYKN